MFSFFSLTLLSLALAVAGGPTNQYSGRQENTGGFATSYSQGGFPGACGQVHSDSDHIVALPSQVYAGGANCGRTVQVTDVSNGITANAIVADECFTCVNAESLDLSLGFFQVFAPLSTGEFPIEWEFVN